MLFDTSVLRRLFSRYCEHEKLCPEASRWEFYLLPSERWLLCCRLTWFPLHPVVVHSQKAYFIDRVFGTCILRYSQIQHVKDGINAKNSLESGQYRSGRIVSPLTKQIVLQGFGWPLPLEVRRASRVFIAL